MNITRPTTIMCKTLLITIEQQPFLFILIQLKAVARLFFRILPEIRPIPICTSGIRRWDLHFDNALCVATTMATNMALLFGFLFFEKKLFFCATGLKKY